MSLTSVVGMFMALLPASALRAEDGHECWLRYPQVSDPALLQSYRTSIREIVNGEKSPIAQRSAEELATGLSGLLGQKIAVAGQASGDGAVVLRKTSPAQPPLPDGSFVVQTRTIDGKRCIVIESASDVGLLYGAFRFLRQVQTHQSIGDLDVKESPKMALRVMEQWDNFDGTVERGNAGRSIFNWSELPKLDPRYREYARLLASVGVNLIVINDVNAQTEYLETETLAKVAALADVFREYGVRLGLSIRYDSPTKLGHVSSDPLQPECEKWWKDKVEEIYTKIPDFGGFLVKADSENRPGPEKFGRTHAEGSRVLARPLKEHGGVVLWRAFVYGKKELGPDRACQAYEFFHPLDGKFDDNVILQVKNGPIDFRPREPLSPLLGAMPGTHEALELQITQEYTGQSTHLCWLVPQWKEVLDFDMGGDGAASPMKRLVGGIAGVSNIGLDRNWTGHHLAQANLYGYGRLAWDPDVPSQRIAEEWTKMTFGDDPAVVKTVTTMLLESWPIYESYTAPLGLGELCYANDHLHPDLKKHKPGDRDDVGTDRTVQTGSGYTGQYAKAVAARYETTENCPDELLLFFHRVPYTYKLHSGKTVIQHIYDSHFDGVERVRELTGQWQSLKGKIDDQRYSEALASYHEQLAGAIEWRDAVNGYFFKESKIPDEKGRIK